MSLLTRWDPMQDIQEFEKRLSSWMGKSPLPKDRDKESMRVMDWAPSVDITEDDKEYLIKADLPEIKKEDVIYDHECHFVNVIFTSSRYINNNICISELF